jgi:hypothetical protein
MPVSPGEERQQTCIFPLDLAEIVAEQVGDLVLGQVETAQQRARAEQRRRRRRPRGLDAAIGFLADRAGFRFARADAAVCQAWGPEVFP